MFLQSTEKILVYGHPVSVPIISNRRITLLYQNIYYLLILENSYNFVYNVCLYILIFLWHTTSKIVKNKVSLCFYFKSFINCSRSLKFEYKIVMSIIWHCYSFQNGILILSKYFDIGIFVSPRIQNLIVLWSII